MPHSKAAPLTFYKNIHFLAHRKHWKQWKKISTGLPQNVTPSKTGGTVFCVWFSIIKKTFWITWPFRKWKVSAARTCLFTWQWIKVKTSEITQTHSTTTSPGLCFWADFCACMKALPTHISIIKAKSRDKVFVFVFFLNYLRPIHHENNLNICAPCQLMNPKHLHLCPNISLLYFY